MEREDALQPFSWSLYLFIQSIFLSLHFPTTWNAPRIVCFLVLAGALFHLHTRSSLFSPGEVYVLGCSNAILFCAAFYIVFIDHDFPDGLRRARDAGSAEVPSKYPLRRRLDWMLDLGGNIRRIGWLPAQSNTEKTPAPSTRPRWLFVISRVALAALCLVVFQVIIENRSMDPSWDPRVQNQHHGNGLYYISRKSLVLRGIDVISWTFCIATEMSFLQSLAAAITVGLGVLSPEDWPILFGSPLDAYTVRNFWT
jgi:hypothetical protein